MKGLLVRWWLMTTLARVPLLRAFFCAVVRRTERGGGLRNSVLMHEALADAQASIHFAPMAVLGYPDIRKAHPRMIGRHIERPQPFFDFHAGGTGRHHKARDALRVPIAAPCACKGHHVRSGMHARGPHFLPVDEPASMSVFFLPDGARFHEGCIRPMVRLGQAEGGPHFSAGQSA